MLMSLDTRIGSDLIVDSPILDQQQMRALEQALPDLQRVDVTFDRAQGIPGALEPWNACAKRFGGDTELLRRLLCSAIAEHVNSGRLYPFCWRWPAAWKEMVLGGHFRVPIVVETAQVIETHHGAFDGSGRRGGCPPISGPAACGRAIAGGAVNYRAAVTAGLRKVLSRMGI